MIQADGPRAQRHASTFIVTLLTAMVWLPWVIIGIPAGAWAGRLPPRPVMLASDAISVAVYASVPVAAWCGVLTVAQLIAATLIDGAAAVFVASACQVLLPGVTGESDLTEGNARLLGSRQAAQIGGPGLGGLLALCCGLPSCGIHGHIADRVWPGPAVRAAPAGSGVIRRSASPTPVAGTCRGGR
jgi:MFS family permease